MGDPRAEAVLVAALRSDPYAYVREAAADALGRSGTGAAALRYAAKRDDERRVRHAAEKALRALRAMRQRGGNPGRRAPGTPGN